MKRYTTDTHSILWHLAKNRRLSRRARRAFVSANEGTVQILVPSMVLVEAIFLAQRQRVSEKQVAGLFSAVSEEARASFRIVPLDMAVAEAVGHFGPAAIPDMPDRIIAATARALAVPLITADSIIGASGLVDVVW